GTGIGTGTGTGAVTTPATALIGGNSGPHRNSTLFSGSGVSVSGGGVSVGSGPMLSSSPFDSFLSNSNVSSGSTSTSTSNGTSTSNSIPAASIFLSTGIANPASSPAGFMNLSPSTANV